MYKQPQKIITHYATQKYDLKRSQSTDKQPQKVTIWYSAQINNLTKVITHYPTQKYDLKRSQSGIPHRQMTSKGHNLVFPPHRRMTSQMHSTSKGKDHNLVSHHRLIDLTSI